MNLKEINANIYPMFKTTKWRRGLKMGCGCGGRSSFAKRKIVTSKAAKRARKKASSNTKLIASRKKYKIKSKSKKTKS